MLFILTKIVNDAYYLANTLTVVMIQIFMDVCKR